MIFTAWNIIVMKTVDHLFYALIIMSLDNEHYILSFFINCIKNNRAFLREILERYWTTFVTSSTSNKFFHVSSFRWRLFAGLSRAGTVLRMTKNLIELLLTMKQTFSDKRGEIFVNFLMTGGIVIFWRASWETPGRHPFLTPLIGHGYL